MTAVKIEKCLADNSDIEKINRFTRRELSADEVYTFTVTLCDNDIDRDFEKFSTQALEELAELFVGKTGISDHSMKSADQRARIFDAYTEKQSGMKTLDGEELVCLKAKAYMLKSEENLPLIKEIEAGIKKEVSVSCSMKNATCSVCGNDRSRGICEHIKGKSYSSTLCFNILSGAQDAYEFSFVAVPAQKRAGVTKAFITTEDTDMNDIIKEVKECPSKGITLTKSQAGELTTYLAKLEEEAALGEEYKKELSREVTLMLTKKLPEIDLSLLGSITSVMTVKELLGFKEGLNKGSAPKPQLITEEKHTNTDYSQFKI